MNKAPIETEENSFPAELKDRYEPCSCLAWNDEEEIYYCLEKSSGQKVLVKIARSEIAVRRLRQETDILRVIADTDHPVAKRFPRVLDHLCLSDGSCAEIMVRSYISGHSLEAIVETQPDKPGLSREATLAYMQEVLEQLAFLHHFHPPVIHRDIKPQNVIVDEEGRCHLIDLDIARVQRVSTDSDTLIIGTRLTSPPEQYGFRPTDTRSDIYSAGILMLYCLTGEYGVEAIRLLPQDLQRIVKKATAFDPENRYQRVEAFGDDIKRTRYGRTRRSPIWILLLLLVTAAAVAVIMSSRKETNPGLQEPAASAWDGKPIRITDSMFDGDEELYRMFQHGNYGQCSAVILPDGLHVMRYENFAELNQNLVNPDKTILSAKELEACLDAIRSTGWWANDMSIAILGRTVESLEPFRTDYLFRNSCLEFHSCILPSDPDPLRAFAPAAYELCCYNTSVGWKSLDFLQAADRLDVLDLTFEGITEADLSALKELKGLRILRLNNIRLTETDLDAIGTMRRLEELQLEGCGITDLSALSGLVNLKRIDLDNNPVTDLGPLERIPGLEEIVCNVSRISEK